METGSDNTVVATGEQCQLFCDLKILVLVNDVLCGVGYRARIVVNGKGMLGAGGGIEAGEGEELGAYGVCEILCCVWGGG